MLEKLRAKISEAKSYFTHLLLRIFGVAALLKRATDEINRLRSECNELESSLSQVEADLRKTKDQYRFDVDKLQNKLSRWDRDAAIQVRSQLSAVNFENLGEIIWIQLGDDRMIRHDVFNQIRDFMRNRVEHSILLVTGQNVDFKALSEEDLIYAGLKRMPEQEWREALNTIASVGYNQFSVGYE